MAQSVTLNGVVYTVPDVREESWGQNVTDYLVAIAASVLQKSGGAFTLTADADFGATFGLKSVYFKTRTANPAASGVLRLANNEGIAWRNAANGADLLLKANASDLLEYEGVPLANTTGLQTLSSKTLEDPVLSLTADLDFGATYSPKAVAFKSRSANPASAGILRLANNEGIYWRNAANSADLGFLLDASDNLYAHLGSGDWFGVTNGVQTCKFSATGVFNGGGGTMYWQPISNTEMQLNAFVLSVGETFANYGSIKAVGPSKSNALRPHNDTTVTGTTATLGGIGTSPAGAAQVGWFRVDINGTESWVPYWQ